MQSRGRDSTWAQNGYGTGSSGYELLDRQNVEGTRNAGGCGDVVGEPVDRADAPHRRLEDRILAGVSSIRGARGARLARRDHRNVDRLEGGHTEVLAAEAGRPGNGLSAPAARRATAAS